jgi:hypothetical protein
MSGTRMSKHQVAVAADSWCIGHLILPGLINDPIEWIHILSKRSEVPSDAFGVISSERYAFDNRLCIYLRSHRFLTEYEFVTHFQKTSVSDSSTLDLNDLGSVYFPIPAYFTNAGVPPHEFLKSVFIWHMFLNQKHFRPYWDSVEGVGISVMRDFFPPHNLRLLDGYLVPIPTALLHVPPPKYIRDSRTADSYIGGPVSLVNHACSKHSNCVLSLDDGVRLAADTFIMSGAKIYICYNDKEDELLSSRGFKCAICTRYSYLSLLTQLFC